MVYIQGLIKEFYFKKKDFCFLKTIHFLEHFFWDILKYSKTKKKKRVSNGRILDPGSASFATDRLSDFIK